MSKLGWMLAAWLVALTAVVEAEKSFAEDLQSLVAACNANAACAHRAVDADGGILFVIHGDMWIRYVKCDEAGSCVWKLPKGKSIAMSHPPRVLASR